MPPEHTGPDIWTILTALGTLAAVFAALFVALLPKLDAYRHRPRLSLAVAPGAPDLDMPREGLMRHLSGDPAKGIDPKAVTLRLRLLVRNAGGQVVNCRVALVGMLVDDKARDLAYPRFLPWSLGQFSSRGVSATFVSRMAVDFLVWGISPYEEDDGNQIKRGTLAHLDVSVAQRFLHDSKFSIRAQSSAYCVVEVSADNVKSSVADVYVVKVENRHDDRVEIDCKDATNLPLGVAKFANVTVLPLGEERDGVLRSLRASGGLVAYLKQLTSRKALWAVSCAAIFGHANGLI